MGESCTRDWPDDAGNLREFPGLPDVFYALRIKHLAESGAIEAAGNLNRMRYSEIRLPDLKPTDSQ
jgi:hypothetical protein